jgi:hypothetical protein
VPVALSVCWLTDEFLPLQAAAGVLPRRGADDAWKKVAYTRSAGVLLQGKGKAAYFQIMSRKLIYRLQTLETQMTWLFLFGVVIASIPMLALALWFAGPIDEVFNWLTDDTVVAFKHQESRDAAAGHLHP